MATSKVARSYERLLESYIVSIGHETRVNASGGGAETCEKLVGARAHFCAMCAPGGALPTARYDRFMPEIRVERGHMSTDAMGGLRWGRGGEGGRAGAPLSLKGPQTVLWPA